MLDLIFCTEDDLVSEVVVSERLTGSDHHMFLCMVGANVGTEVVRSEDRWNLSRTDYNSFRRDLFVLPR